MKLAAALLAFAFPARAALFMGEPVRLPDIAAAAAAPAALGMTPLAPVLAAAIPAAAPLPALPPSASPPRAAGVRTLYVRATESSRGFYRGRFGSRVRFVEPEDAGDGETLYRLEIDLR
ncbi:MAG: hypothetical protein KGL74_04870 [Elusimicrobia bacterium]|nr:hypothetical protein [Elusimicrobiota bacterium]MDE2510433.1 hypothetical protein [Elusimicrobiota bacterium]